MSDWLDNLTPEEREDWDRIVEHFRRDALEKMTDSAFVASVVPSEDKFDVKFAMETGAAVLLDKPIMAIVLPGVELPGKLARVADEVVRADLDTEEGKKEIHEALSRMTERLQSPPAKEEEVLAVWFTPEAIRQHFELHSDNVARWVATATDAELLEVALHAMDADALWSTFHDVLVASIEGRLNW